MSETYPVFYITASRRHLDAEQSLDHRSAIVLCAKDIKILVNNVTYLPKAFLPFRWPRPVLKAPYDRRILIRDYALVAFVAILEILLALIAAPALMVLYSRTIIAYACLAASSITAISSIMWEDPIIRSQLSLDVLDIEGEHWISVNGIGTR